LCSFLHKLNIIPGARFLVHHLCFNAVKGKTMNDTIENDKKLSKGIFWLVYDKLVYCSATCNISGDPLEELNENALSVLGTFNHKTYWASLPTATSHGKSYNYFPRGRVEITNGRAKVFLSPHLCIDEIKEKIVQQFGLMGIEIKYIPDGSNHYRCYLDCKDE